MQGLDLDAERKGIDFSGDLAMKQPLLFLMLHRQAPYQRPDCPNGPRCNIPIHTLEMVDWLIEIGGHSELFFRWEDYFTAKPTELLLQLCDWIEATTGYKVYQWSLYNQGHAGPNFVYRDGVLFKRCKEMGSQPVTKTNELGLDELTLKVGVPTFLTADALHVRETIPGKVRILPVPGHPLYDPSLPYVKSRVEVDAPTKPELAT